MLGTAHHFRRWYAPHVRLNELGEHCNLDVQSDAVITTINDIFSRRDMGRLGGPRQRRFPANEQFRRRFRRRDGQRRYAGLQHVVECAARHEFAG